MITVTLTIVDDATPSNPLEAVVVRVYSEDGLTFVTQAQTDANGEVALDLVDDTTYWVRFFKIGYQFDTRLTIDVDSAATSNTFDIIGTDLTVLPPSTVPILCKASGYVADPALHPKEGVVFTFTLTGKPRVAAGRAMVLQDLIAVSDADGWVEVELVRGGIYDCVVSGQDDVVYRVVVPDRTSVSITELVWPYVVSLTYERNGTPLTSVSLAVGEELELDVYVTLSNGVVTPYTMDDGVIVDVGNFLLVTLSAEDVVTYTFSEGVLTLTGASVGSTTLEATLKDGVEADRLPEPTRSFPTLSISVTA